MLGKALALSSLATLLLAACGRQEQSGKRPVEVAQGQAPEARGGCDTSKYGSTRYLAGLPLVRQASGREDLAADLATRSQSVLVTTPRGRRVIAAISWGGPNGGALVLMSCDGTPLGSAELGYVRSLRAQDLTGDGVAELIVEQQTGSGTGLVERQTTVYGIAGDTIAALWSTVSFAGSYQSAELGGTWEMRANVSFPSIGRIRVERDSMPVRYDSRTKQWEPLVAPKRRYETFVFDRKLGIFVREQAA